MLLEKEEETIVKSPQRDIDEEKQIFSIRPTMIFVKIGYALAVVGGFLVVFLLYFISQFFGFDIPALIYVLLGLSLLLIPAYFHIKRNLIKYTLTDSKIEIDEGFFFQQSRNIPLRSIQDVSVSMNLIQRILGYGDITIDNASEDAGKIVLKNVAEPKKYADLLLKQLRKVDKQ
ncbi:MAG: PH domain-containing protein [Pyrinomonadaceae bacterium]